MRVRIDIGLDFDGLHTFAWKESKAPGAIDIPAVTLERWAAEREAFGSARLRWRAVLEEIDEHLLGQSHRGTAPAELAVVVKEAKARARRW